MTATLEARALQVANREMDFLEAFSWLVQDELDRRRSRLLERRHALSGLPDRKDLTRFDWSYNPRLPKRNVLELATLKFLDAKEDVLVVGPPGTGKSHIAKALATAAVSRGYKVLYREAHQSNRRHHRSPRAGRDPETACAHRQRRPAAGPSPETPRSRRRRTGGCPDGAP